MLHQERLDEAVMSVCPVQSIQVVVPGSPDGVIVNFDPAATDQQKAAAAAALAAFDWSEEAFRAWELAKVRQAALTSLLTRDDELSIGIRASLFSIVDLMNLRLDALGQTKVLLPEVLGYIQSHPTIGDPVK